MNLFQRCCFAVILFVLFLIGSAHSIAQEKILDLQGTWRFDIDREEVGVRERWFERSLKDRVVLPGSMTENRKGDKVTLHTPWTASIYDSSFFYNPRLERFRRPDHLKIPFWLTPVTYYVGPAWYQTDITLPVSWKEDRIRLFLERPHTETRLWVNGREAGMQNSLSVPHVYEISRYLKKGSNTLTLCIDNRTKEIDVGKDSHSITDQTQGNWNGVVGRIELQATPRTFLEDVQVYPDVKGRKARVKVRIEGQSSGSIRLEAESFNGEIKHLVSPVTAVYETERGSAFVEMELPLGEEMLLWDEFHPNLYRLKVSLQSGKETDFRELSFGMREFTIRGKYFYVNGRQTILRGTVENCVFPLTGYAPMDVASWERVFRICRNFGLNHMRFHSFCPPEAAFIAADRIGFYLQPEGPSWPNHGTSLGDGHPVDDYLMEESKRIVKAYGNHPSFCLFAIGNEPRGRWVPWVSRFVDYWKATDSRRVYTGASVGNGWAWQPENEFHVKAGARGLSWEERPESNSDFRERIDTVRQPYISHETGQWCVFPDFTEIPKYTGVMRARNFELFREDLKERHMGDLSAAFLRASGKLQALCYKHEIEKTLRTPGYAGFQLLSLNDYPGQGTALVGVLNAFWEEKGYIDAEEFRRFCAPTVLLARMDKFVFTNNETMTARIEAAHFGEKPFVQQVTRWKVTGADGEVLAEGSLPPHDLKIGNCQVLGQVSFLLQGIKKARQLNLSVSFEGTDCSNHWDFWVYPTVLPVIDTSSVYITDTIDAKAKSLLTQGGKVLLLLAGKMEKGKEIIQYMTPAFWNTSWFKMRPPHTVGTLIQSFHPVFSDFPTDDYTGLQWWELVNKGQVMELTDFPAAFQPIVQPIDTWFINRKLGVLFEAMIGSGKMVVCSADLLSDWEHRPVARQLYFSILKYMNSTHFFPEQTLALPELGDLLKRGGERIQMNTQDAPDELKPGIR